MNATQNSLVRLKNLYHDLMGAPMVADIFELWTSSLPDPDPTLIISKFNLQIIASSSVQKLTLRAEGPQNLMVARLIDFFYNISRPRFDFQVEKLTDFGSFINPKTLGSWIEITEQRVTGGWIFPLKIPISQALSASEPGHASRSLLDWVHRHKIAHCSSLSGEMGQDKCQTDIQLRLRGKFADQVYLALDAFSFFGFPSVPAKAVDIILQAEPENPKDRLRLCVTISKVGCTRISILLPSPGSLLVRDLCSLTGDAQKENLAKLEDEIKAQGPVFVEYQCVAEECGRGQGTNGLNVSILGLPTAPGIPDMVREFSRFSYPKSFLALCLSSKCVQRDKNGAIIVQERNTDLFPLVTKYYLSGKVKIASASIDLESVKEELSFWFPGEALNIQYKDPIFNLAYIRRLEVKEFMDKERESIHDGILARAAAGYLEFTKTIDDSLMQGITYAGLNEYRRTYLKLVEELFPTDKFMVLLASRNSVKSDASTHNLLFISWKIGEGEVGRSSAKKAKAECKMVLAIMAKIVKEQCFKGDYRVDLKKIWDVIPQYFFDFFPEYVKKKSTHKLNITFTDSYVCWNSKELDNIL